MQGPQIISMKIKIILSIIVVAVISVAATWYYVFVYSKNNHRKIDNEIAIPITAVDIVKEYQVNEKIANSKYLNKAIQVTGIVTQIDKNQDGLLNPTEGRYGLKAYGIDLS